MLNDYQRSDVSTLLAQVIDLSKPSFALSQLSQYPMTHPLWQQIVHIATIGETYFFRNRPQFNALRSVILPALIESRREAGLMHLRLWSAGCATGEEPYSLAILLRELIHDIADWNITLLATDINDDYLAKAKQGVYRPRSFRNETPDHIQTEWFTDEPDGYHLSKTIRDMVHFKKLNLVSDLYPTFENNTTYMDVILCRNVTIYFDIATTREVVRRFQRSLSSNGWLVVGHAEPHSVLYQGFMPQNFKDTVIYQKVAEAQTVPTIPAAPPPHPAPLSKTQAKTTVRTKPYTAKKEAPAPAAADDKDTENPSVQQCWTKAKEAADNEQWDEANSWLNRAEAQNQFYAPIHYLRGLMHLSQGAVDDGLNHMRRAIYCDSSFIMAHYIIGDIFHLKKKSSEAERHWNLALNAVASLDMESPLPHSDDLTAEMMKDLLTARLSEL